MVKLPASSEGMLRCYMRDPDGRLIEVGQAASLLQATGPAA